MYNYGFSARRLTPVCTLYIKLAIIDTDYNIYMNVDCNCECQAYEYPSKLSL